MNTSEYPALKRRAIHRGLRPAYTVRRRAYTGIVGTLAIEPSLDNERRGAAGLDFGIEMGQFQDHSSLSVALRAFIPIRLWTYRFLVRARSRMTLASRHRQKIHRRQP